MGKSCWYSWSSFRKIALTPALWILLLLSATVDTAIAEAPPRSVPGTQPAPSTFNTVLPDPLMNTVVEPHAPIPAPAPSEQTDSPLLLGSLIAALLVSLALLSLLGYLVFRLKRQLAESESQAQHHEARLKLFSSAVEKSPMPIIITGPDARIEYVNQQFTRSTGYTASESMGLNPSFLSSGQTPSGVFQDMWLTLRQGRHWSGEFVNRHKDGRLYWEESHISPVMGANGQPRHYVAIQLDVSARKRAEMQNQTRTHVLELLAGDSAISDILVAIAHDVETGNPEIRCGVMLVDAEGKRLFNAAAPSLPEPYLAAIDGVVIAPHVGSCAAAAWSKQRVVVENIQTHPNWLDYRELAAQAKLGACWSEPILSASGAILGTLAIYHGHPQAPTPNDLQILEQAARLAAIAIDHSRAQEALRESEERHRLLADNASDVIWILDFDGHFTFVSPSVEKLLGYMPEEAMSLGLEQLCTPASAALAVSELERMKTTLATEGDALPFRGEIENVCKDGGTVWTDVSTSLMKDVAGQVIGILGVTRDISRRKQAELALQKLNMELEERIAARTAELATSEERFRLAMDAATDGLWDTYYLTGESYFSPGYFRMLGYEPDELPQRLDTWLGLMHPDDLAALNAVRDEKFAADHFEAEFRMKAKDGAYRWILSRGRVMSRDAQGRVERALGTHTDITERHRAEQAIRDLNTGLEQKVAERTAQLVAASAAKTQFLAHMSHELRTPMNAILGLTQILARDELAPDQREMITTIGDAGASLLAIIDDILDFSKVEAGEMRMEMQPFELDQLLNRLANLIEVSAKNRGIDFTITGRDVVDGSLIGDSSRIEQILSNLCSNAVKFTDQGSVAVSVQALASEPDNVRLRFEVRDTGIGISPESLSRLFKPFSQADESITRRYGGTGLGLAISLRLVELMGGTIGADSTLGEGSTFWFELPFQRAGTSQPESANTDPATEPATDPTTPPSSRTRLQGLKVLVVDDNLINRMLIERALKLEGAETTLASDGQQALEILWAQPRHFQAVLMDIQMPVMDGLTATRAIRADETLGHLPVIAFTAGVLNEERQAALDAGVDDFLTKPVDLERLTALLAPFIQRSGLEVETVSP